MLLSPGEKTSYKTSRHIGWNLIWLAYEVFVENMEEKFLTPLNTWEKLIHSYFLTFVCIIMLRFQESIILECILFIIRLILIFNPSPVNWLTWLQKV